VGSGDAFSAGLVHEYLHGASLELMNEVANLVGAWVASEVGAMPTPKRGALENSLAKFGSSRIFTEVKIPLSRGAREG